MIASAGDCEISKINSQTIGTSLTINVGKGGSTMDMADDGKVSITAKEEISFTVGSSSLTLFKDGNIIMNGNNIIIEGMQNTKIIGHTSTEVGKCSGLPGVVINDNISISGAIVTIKGSTEVDIN